MNRIVRILMDRDDMTHQEAESLYNECRERALDNPDDAENILACELGLEPDYLFDLLF